MKTRQPKIRIRETASALNGFNQSFSINIINNKDPLIQLNETRNKINKFLSYKLKTLFGLKFIETIKVTFMKMKDDGFEHKIAHFNGKPQIITNQNQISQALKISKLQILNFIAQWQSEGSDWIIESVDNHFLNILVYRLLKGSSYIKLPQELNHHMKGLINLQNNDNKCFRWCHIRYLNPQDKDPHRIKKCDKDFINKLDYSGIEFPVRVN